MYARHKLVVSDNGLNLSILYSAGFVDIAVSCSGYARMVTQTLHIPSKIAAANRDHDDAETQG